MSEPLFVDARDCLLETSAASSRAPRSMSSTTPSMKPSIKASIKACVMCGAPLARWRPLEEVLCRSKACAAQHAALLPAFKCGQCTRPLTIRQRASGHCDSPTCRDEELRVRRERKAARHQALLARLERRRARSAAQRRIARDEQDTYRLAIVPHNDDRVSRLPQRRRASHETHLRECLATARKRLAVGESSIEGRAVTPPDVVASPAQRAEAQLLLAACAACRGACCRQAGDHSFITDEVMLAQLQRAPALDDDTIVARYLQHVGEQTMTHGCVYQGVRGCTLSPDLRADICHRFHCTGLLMLKDRFAEGEPLRAYMVHRRGEDVTGDRFVEIPVPNAPHPSEAEPTPD